MSAEHRWAVVLALVGLTVACSANNQAGVADSAASPGSSATTLAAASTTPSSEDVPSAPPPAGFSLVLGRPTGESITASALTETDQTLVIAYRPASGSGSGQVGPVALKAGQPRSVDINGLAPDTSYTYTVSLDGAAVMTHTFQTARQARHPFTFTIDADPHNRDPKFNGDVYTAALTNASADHPDFHVNLGDTFMTEKVKAKTVAEAESTFTDMRPYLGIIGANAPLFLVNGNHEGELGWLLPRGADRDLPLWSTKLRQQYYPNPMPGGFYSGASSIDTALGSTRDGYYAWTWGDALFIALDPFWYTTDKPRAGATDSNWGWTLGREQYDWLAATLDASHARYTFVFIHHLVGGADEARGGIEVAGLYEWGGKNADGSDGFATHRPGWGKPIHQLLVDHHVSAVFHGHDHVFVKQDLDGIVYQEVPQPSVTDYGNTRIATEYGYTHGDVLGSSGYMRVTVGPSEATVDYVRAYRPQDESANRHNGQVDYHYVLRPRP